MPSPPCLRTGPVLGPVSKTAQSQTELIVNDVISKPNLYDENPDLGLREKKKADDSSSKRFGVNDDKIEQGTVT
ncbi:hypothetical protein SLEP1_g30307 [Rubroshorea leprosula]|uniref:Uncharacterized protein n=1 Tax=Rubroshorea leprosula TaxID=152421 RepID=A0AAV5K5W2_9ROSI|nr:hypothetical protein SLEP1_g30307 [Rubroshorea leprosula]